MNADIAASRGETAQSSSQKSSRPAPAQTADDSDFELDPEVQLANDMLMGDMLLDFGDEAAGADDAEGDDFELAPDVDLPANSSVDGSDDFDMPTASVDTGDDYQLVPEDVPALSDVSGEAEVETSSVADVPVETPAPQAAPADETPAKPAAVPSVKGEGSEAHSVATAGDVLLEVALAEEAESAKRREEARTGGNRKRKGEPVPGESFVVYCPSGHRILVLEKHRGRTGRCPNCKSLYFVPPAPVAATTGSADPAADGASVPGAEPSGPAETGYAKWILDVRLHRVNPLKLKVKADSLLNDYDTADIGLNPEHVLVAVVYQGGGAFRSMQEPKKKPATRQAMLEHLAAKGPLTALPVTKHFEMPLQQLGQLKIVQPEVFGEDSLFVGIPVFGVGRIAIRVPAGDSATERTYISFTLSQFREFSQIVGEAAQVERFGAVASIPLEDETTQLTCHYSDNKLQSLEHVEFYTADPAFKIAPIGRKCQSCGLIVSEDSRKKEKISSKCPKCKGKFGNIVLQGLKSGPGVAAPAS